MEVVTLESGEERQWALWSVCPQITYQPPRLDPNPQVIVRVGLCVT